MKQSIRECHVQSKLTVIDDSASEQSPAKCSFEVRLPLQTIKRSKQSYEAGKDANQTMRTALLENSELLEFEENIWELFPFGYTKLAPLEEMVSKTVFPIADCPLVARHS